MKRLGAGSAAATLALPALWLQTQDQARCYGLPQALCEHPGTEQMSPEAKLKQWLESRGCQLNNVEVKPSTVGEESGYGLFVAQDARSMRSARRRWWWPFGAPPPFTTVATFPLSSCLTAENILADPQVGGRFGYLLDRGAMNERDIVIGHLAVERARGSHSALAPWIDMLPKESHSPLCWSPSEMAELQGTSLYAATRALKRKLANFWAEVQPVLEAVAVQAGTERAPCWDDMLWAHCMFWSRGHSLPVPKKEGAASNLVAQDPKRAPSFMHVHEGLVPGLDFANHSSLPQCWWEVASHPPTRAPTPANAPSSSNSSTNSNGDGSSVISGQREGVSDNKQTAQAAQAGSGIQGDREGQGLASSILLQLYRGASVGPGQELCINYGDTKSNEELLLLYGFVYDPDLAASTSHGGSIPTKASRGRRKKSLLPGCTSADFSMLACPLAPSDQWDEVMHRRVQLLTCLGLRPQFFLKASEIDASQAQGKPTAPVPIDVVETLEVFVLAADEVAARLETVLLPKAAKEELLQKGQLPQSCATLDLDALSCRVEQKTKKNSLTQQEAESLHRLLGLRMAAVSTFLGLLELRMSELEAPPSGAGSSSSSSNLSTSAGGTGSLEADLELLAQHQRAVQASKESTISPSQQQQQQQQQGTPSEFPLNHRKHCAVVYRVGQKQIVRAYAMGAREELSRIMRLLRAMEEQNPNIA